MSGQLAVVPTGHQQPTRPGTHVHFDQEVTALIGDLKKIGRRLRSPHALNHPSVRAALGQLDSELAVALWPSHGRHRIAIDVGERADAQAASRTRDPACGPVAGSSDAQFVGALRQYRALHGDVPFRQMAARARHVVSHSAMCVALNGDELPPLRVVLAIVVGCGGSIADQERFAAAWNQLRLGSRPADAPGEAAS